jgi:hypothetical protein
MSKSPTPSELVSTPPSTPVPVPVIVTSPSSPSSPAMSAQEERLVRRIHKQLGGQSRLRAITDPTEVRQTVLEALASDQPSPTAAAAVRQNTLTPLQRRAVRTVTNRGAAVRSRIRQRNALGVLKDQLAKKDQQLTALREAYAAMQGILCSVAGASPDTHLPFAQSPSFMLGDCIVPPPSTIPRSNENDIDMHVEDEADADEYGDADDDIDREAEAGPDAVASDGGELNTSAHAYRQPIKDMLCTPKCASRPKPADGYYPTPNGDSYVPHSPVTPRFQPSSTPHHLALALPESYSPMTSPEATPSVHQNSREQSFFTGDDFDLSPASASFDCQWPIDAFASAAPEVLHEHIDNVDGGVETNVEFSSLLCIAGL